MKKQYRVKRNEEIEEILKEKRYSSNPYFSLYRKNNEETGYFRYAISAGKKLGDAVTRNHMKRRVTAILDLLPIKMNKGVDVFIIVRPKALELDFLELKKQLEYLFKKQKLLQGEKND